MPATGDSPDLLKGTLDVMILKALTWGPMHGYDVTRWIRQRTGDLLQVEDAALYQALYRMERRGWLRSEWGRSENNRRAKYYRLSAQGRRELRAQTYVDPPLRPRAPVGPRGQARIGAAP